jgi:hypothetical protein
MVINKRTPLSLRFSASEVTLSGFAGGEYFPLPASKGLAFPFRSAEPFGLPSMGTPLLQQIALADNGVLHKLRKI